MDAIMRCLGLDDMVDNWYNRTNGLDFDEMVDELV